MAKNKNYYSNTSAYDEAIRTLRTNIQFADIDENLKKIVVSSSVPDEGKTTVAIELARSFAQNNFKVLLVDADLRNPSVSKSLDIANNMGLTNVLLNKKDSSYAIMKDNEEENLDILLSGPVPPNPAEIISSKAMENLMETLEENYDYIIIDSPPVGIITDAAILSTMADGVLLVTRTKSTKKDQIKSAIDNIDSVGSKIIGVVLTFVDKKDSTYKSYYK